jgi:putative ABC transport system substrate-binding protein
MIRRREFITLLGGAAASWPLAAGAQQPAMPVIGFLRSTSLANAAHLVTAFRQGLKETGYVEGQNVAIEYRSAEDHHDQLPILARDLIRRQIVLIVANHNAALAAKATTTTVPIIFATGGDPIRDGLVTSLNRPGGNVTGVSFLNSLVGSKRLELLHEAVPKAAIIAVLANLHSNDAEAEVRDVQVAARAIGQEVMLLEVTGDSELETAFATLVQRGTGALIVVGGAFMNSHRERLVALAARHDVPAMYHLREFAAAGGLMSYAPSITNAYRQTGIYAGRILNGEKPGDLPVMQSTKFELVINLKTAKALALQIPDKMLALADEVIE